MKNGQSVSFISTADFISDKSTQEAVYQQWPRDHHHWVWSGRVSHGNSAGSWWPTSYSHWARLERTRQDCWGAASTRRAGCFGQTWAKRLLSRLLLKWRSFFFQMKKIWRKKMPFFLFKPIYHSITGLAMVQSPKTATFDQHAFVCVCVFLSFCCKWI